MIKNKMGAFWEIRLLSCLIFVNLRCFHIYKSSPYSWGGYEKYELQINYIRLPQYCTQKKFSTCKFTAFCIHFHGQMTPKWPKSLSPSPWQPDIDTKNFDTCFRVFASKGTSGANFIKIWDMPFPAPIVNTLVLKENWY